MYITAPDPIEHPMYMTVDAIGKALGLNHGAIRQDLPIRIIDAGLRTLIVPIADLETEISVFPNEQELKIFCKGNDIDIILIFSKQTTDADAFAHKSLRPQVRLSRRPRHWFWQQCPYGPPASGENTCP